MVPAVPETVQVPVRKRQEAKSPRPASKDVCEKEKPAARTHDVFLTYICIKLQLSAKIPGRVARCHHLHLEPLEGVLLGGGLEPPPPPPPRDEPRLWETLFVRTQEEPFSTVAWV